LVLKTKELASAQFNAFQK